MMPLLDTNQLDAFEAELGMPVGQLITPRDGSPRGLVRDAGPFGVDNMAFSSWDEAAFVALVEKLRPHRPRCLFVAVPDVIAARCPTAEEEQRAARIPAVGNANLTLQVFRRWRHRLTGWPLAYVAQNGAEAQEIPWEQIEAVFIGGDDDWKDSHHAACVVKAAKMLGKHVHVGRVNGPRRFRHFERLGADTCDGTGLVTTTRQRHAIRDRHTPQPQPAPMFD